MVEQGVPEGTCSQVLRSTSVCSVLRASNFPCLKFIEIVVFTNLPIYNAKTKTQISICRLARGANRGDWIYSNLLCIYVSYKHIK